MMQASEIADTLFAMINLPDQTNFHERDDLCRSACRSSAAAEKIGHQDNEQEGSSCAAMHRVTTDVRLAAWQQLSRLA